MLLNFAFMNANSPMIYDSLPLSPLVRAVDLLLDTGDAAARVRVCTRRALDVNICNGNIVTHCRARAHQIPDKWIILLARGALEILDGDVGDGQLGWKLVTQRNVLLAVALRDLNGVVDVGELHSVIGDVLDRTATTTTLQVAGKGGGSTGPNFDACAIRGIRHADVKNGDVLNDVDLSGILAETAD